MFDYKRLFLMFFAGIVTSLGAMDSDGSAMDKNSLAEQSDEMKVDVIFAIPFVTGYMQAAFTINALVRSCKGFCRIINDDKVTKDLVKMLVMKFGGYHEKVARLLATQGAQKYIKSHTNVLQMWCDLFRTETTVQKAQHLLDSMGDIGFVDQNGKSVLCHMIFPFTCFIPLIDLYKKVDLDAYKKSFIDVFTHVFNYGKQQGVVWDLEKFITQVASLGWHELGIVTAQLDEGALLRATILIECRRPNGYDENSTEPRTWFQDDGGAPYEVENSVSSLLIEWIKQAKQDKQ